MLLYYGGSVNARCMLTDLAPFHFYLGIPVIWAQAMPQVHFENNKRNVMYIYLEKIALSS